MNCADVRDRLALLLYGDLSAAETALAEAHLADCVSCRTKRLELDRVRRALDSVPARNPQINMNALYQRLAERQLFRARRWRRTALAIAAAAAALLLVAALRLHVRVQKNELLVGWGETLETAPLSAARPPADSKTPDVASLREEVHTLAELVQAVAADVDSRDRGRQQDQAALQARLESLQEAFTRLQSATERDVAALYAVHFPPNSKGVTP
jgi:predicted anti-sigma-YlaC factor YlaD